MIVKPVALSLISSGIYGYPREEALQVATSAIHNFLLDYDLSVTLVVYDKATFSISQKQLGLIESYMREHYIADHEIRKRPLIDSELADLSDAIEVVPYFSEPIFENQAVSPNHRPTSLADLVNHLGESFSQMLLQLIDNKAMTDVVAVYKRANLDRRLFSKIRSNKGLFAK